MITLGRKPHGIDNNTNTIDHYSNIEVIYLYSLN